MRIWLVLPCEIPRYRHLAHPQQFGRGPLLKAVPRVQGDRKGRKGLRSTLERSDIALAVAHRWQQLAAKADDGGKGVRGEESPYAETGIPYARINELRRFYGHRNLLVPLARKLAALAVRDPHTRRVLAPGYAHRDPVRFRDGTDAAPGLEAQLAEVAT